MSEMNEIRRRINQAIARGDEKEAAFARAEFWQTKAESLQRERDEARADASIMENYLLRLEAKIEFLQQEGDEARAERDKALQQVQSLRNQWNRAFRGSSGYRQG